MERDVHIIDFFPHTFACDCGRPRLVQWGDRGKVVACLTCGQEHGPFELRERTKADRGHPVAHQEGKGAGQIAGGTGAAGAVGADLSSSGEGEGGSASSEVDGAAGVKILLGVVISISLALGTAILVAYDVSLLGALLGMGVFLVVGTLVGALLLRAAIGAYNAMIACNDPEVTVPEPRIGKAMTITFVATLVNLIAGMVLGVLGGGLAGPEKVRAESGDVIAQFFALPVGLFVMAFLLAVLLPTTFARAFWVTICYLAIALVMGGTITAVLLFVLP